YRFDALGGAHAGQRLIEQKQAGRRGKGKADLQPSLFAVSQFGNRRVQPRGQVDERCRVFDLLGETWHIVNAAEQVEPEPTPRQAERSDGQVLSDGQPVEELVDLVALRQA